MNIQFKLFTLQNRKQHIQMCVLHRSTPSILVFFFFFRVLVRVESTAIISMIVLKLDYFMKLQYFVRARGSIVG
jgi:hypothetical protein